MAESKDGLREGDARGGDGLARRINDVAAIVSAIGLLVSTLQTNIRAEWMKILGPIAGVSPLIYFPLLLGMLIVVLQFRRIRPWLRWLVTRAQAFGTKYEGAITFFNLICLLFALGATSALTITVSKQLALNESVATRYVTQFPANIDFVNRLLAEVNEGDEVSIVIDFPAYGSVSAPIRARRTEYWLKQIVTKERVHLTIVYSTPNHSMEALREGNHEMEPALKCVNSQKAELGGGLTCGTIAPRVNELHDYLARRQAAGLVGSFLNIEGLNGAFVEDDRKLIDDLFATRVESARVTACPILSATPPAYIWMVRDKKAVFAFAGGKENDTFLTHDTRVLHAFETLIANTIPPDRKGCTSLPKVAEGS